MIVNKEVNFSKVNKEKKEVEVIVRVPNIPDYDGDISTLEDIEEMAHSYPFWGNVDAHHSFNIIGNVSESYILKEKRIEKMPDGRISETPAGSWIAVLKIMDENVWSEVKSGKITGASLVALPGKIKKEDGTEISIRDKRSELIEALKIEDSEEKMTKLNNVLSTKSEVPEGAGGGTTLDYLKSLGLGLEVICISLVETPNQSEAKLLSMKDAKSIKEYLEALKNDIMKSINKLVKKENIVKKEVNIMTKEELIKLLQEDEELRNILVTLLKETDGQEEKEEEILDEEKEGTKEEEEMVEKEGTKEEDKEALAMKSIKDEIEKLKAENEKLKETNEKLSIKSRAMNSEEEKKVDKNVYKRKHGNGIGQL